MTVACIPLVRKLKEPAADEKARQSRLVILQGVLYLALRTTIGARHSGVVVPVGDRILTAFPRVLLSLAGIPEEMSVLCITSGQCSYPCSVCTLCLKEAGSAEALNSGDRDVISTLTSQLDGAGHRLRKRQAHRRVQLEEATSAHSAIPALTTKQGLRTSTRVRFFHLFCDQRCRV